MVSVARKAKRQFNSALLSKLKTALTEIAATPPALSFNDGEAFVCSVCQLPVKLCSADPTMCCADMRLEGTELQLIRRSGKRKSVSCVRCGNTIPNKILKKNPLTELCPSCQNASSKLKSPKRSKGASL